MTGSPVFSAWVGELQRLLAPGLIGQFQAFEATELVAFPVKHGPPVNVLSVIAAEDDAPATPYAPAIQRLTPGLLTVPGLKDWRFGLVRYALRPDDLIAALLKFAATDEWAPAGKPLRLGPVQPADRVFVPADGLKARALNSVLKNNFWGGSHLFELADPDKAALRPLMEAPARLQALSEAVGVFCPLQIARASDRLGNIIIQLPVTAVTASLAAHRPAGGLTLNVAWKPGCGPRPLRLAVDRRFDGVTLAAHSALVGTGSTPLPIADTAGLESATLWDDANALQLWSQAPVARIRQISSTIQIARPEHRRFRHQAGGALQTVKVADADNTMLVGRPDTLDQEAWTRRRLYDAERARLARERRFVQYVPTRPLSAGHETALADIRLLISSFGQKGAWLWDPYLSAEDILKTLFHSPHAGADLRALSDAMSVPRPARPQRRGWTRVVACLWPPKEAPRPSFVDLQRAQLAACGGNLEGMRLEYRARIGHSGWSFHDRFLIFPETREGPLAWSLGTSVNMLGHKHHILQRVDDGRLVADAFEQLWAELGGPEQLIWKTP